MGDKVREYKYDNLKFIMIFFVVFGHFLEMFEGNIRKYIYIIIYTFHVPIFVYISGYFLKGSNKSILKFTYIYLIWQTISLIFDKFVLNINVNFSYINPNWIMWYLFAMIAWNLIIKFFNKFLIKHYLVCLIVAFIISILAGFVDSIGYVLSLSRIITFLPYFLLGYFTKNLKLNWLELKTEGKVNKKKILIIFIITVICIAYFINILPVIKTRWLYGSYSYTKEEYNFIFKIMWILISICWLFLFNNIVTDKKIKIISDIGANTLNIYLVHAIILQFVKQYKANIFVHTEIVNIFLSLLFTGIIFIVLGNKFINEKLTFVTNRSYKSPLSN